MKNAAQTLRGMARMMISNDKSAVKIESGRRNNDFEPNDEQRGRECATKEFAGQKGGANRENSQSQHCQRHIPRTT